MKILFILFLLLSTSGFAQTNTNAPKSTESPSDKSELLKLLELAKQNSDEMSALITKLKKENETLRQIMITYVKQIDQLNTLNLELQSKLDECEKK